MTDVSRALRGTLPFITAAASHTTKIRVTWPAGLGATAGSVLRDGVIAIGVLIVAVACVLIGSATRRRRRAGRPGQPRARRGGTGRARGASHGSHARHSRAAIERGTPQAGPAARGTAGAVGRLPAIAPGRPRIVPLARSGALGPLSRSQRKKTEDRPPWEPAQPPDQVIAADSAPPGHVPLAHPPASRLPDPDPSATKGTGDKEMPPWEQSADAYAAAPVLTDPLDWIVTSPGPMYVWNPAANTGPFPAIPAPGSPLPAEPE